jgi:hypothetical protein
MTQSGTSSAGDERTPPLARELDAVQVSYTWKFGEGGRGEAAQAPEAALPAEDELIALRRQVGQYTAALEDIVTLALSNGEYKERAIMMHRRAVAALSAARPGKR